MSRLRRHWPLLLCLALYATAVAVLAGASYGRAEGRFLYTFDDAWIQLQIARNLVQHGVWGVSPDAFASASSSPLWCLLLAGTFCVAGVWEGMSFTLNVACAAGVIVLAYWILRRLRVATWAALPLLLLLAAAAPLHGIVFVGLEHSLHTLLNLGFLFVAAEEISLGPAEKARPYLLPVLALLLPITRYEGLFGVALVCGCLVLRRRFGRAALVLGLGLAPVVAFGLFSLFHGWHFVPNSVLIKAGLVDASVVSLLDPFRLADYQKLWKHPDLLLLVLGGAVVFLWRIRRDGTPWRTPTLMVLFSTLCILAQVRYGALGWLFRYEVYVIAAAVVAVGAALFFDTVGRRFWPTSLHPAGLVATVLVAAFILIPFATRAKQGTIEAVHGGRDRLVQHVLPAEFVAAYYPSSAVVVNDIGAMGFYSEAHLLDLVGLGSLEPLRFAEQPGGFTKEDVEQWARAQGAEIAVLQAPWQEIQAVTPDSWVVVAVVQLPEDVVYRNRRIKIYACRPEHAGEVRRLAREFLAPRYQRLGVTFR